MKRSFFSLKIGNWIFGIFVFLISGLRIFYINLNISLSWLSNLSGAVSINCTHIATLDKKHLLQPEVRKYLKPIKIQTPGEILEELVI